MTEDPDFFDEKAVQKDDLTGLGMSEAYVRIGETQRAAKIVVFWDKTICESWMVDDAVDGCALILATHLRDYFNELEKTKV